jgi:hypothetical protein
MTRLAMTRDAARDYDDPEHGPFVVYSARP